MRSEFEFIHDIKSRHNLSKVGDDCAVLPKDDGTDLLITSDMLVEGIDFRLEWATPEQIGHKALAVSLSDIAAMGGIPAYAMLSIAIVENLWKGDLLDRLYAGWHALANQFGVELIGGDVSQTSGPLVVDSTVIGSVPRGDAILRSGAKPGDEIYVAGTLGAAGGGLSLLFRGPESAKEAPLLVKKQLQPLPEIPAANSLRLGHLATSMIDVSDGLSSDLRHLCISSRVGAEIDERALPIEPSLFTHFTHDEALDLALHGGEDLSLLFTADSRYAAQLSQLAGITRIGRITSKMGVIELITEEGRAPLEPRGYQHFGG